MNKMSMGGLYYPAYTPGFGSKPRLQTMHPFRNLVAAGSQLNNQWSGGSGHSGYGLETPDYEYHSGPSAHMPSGGSYSYHATAGTGYGPPAAHAVHPPAKPVTQNPTGGGKKGIFGGGGGGGKQGSSAMSAITLLSFLFFINLLQSCIKDHMDAMNPTVMVMTTNIIRNRFNKMGELNSREQSSSSYTANGANIVTQPNDLVQAAAAQSASVVEATRPSVNLQSTYGNIPITFNRPQETSISQPSAPYISNNAEPEIAISYAKPQLDHHKPDVYDVKSQIQHTTSYTNQSLITDQQPPAPYKEQYYNFHHTEYNAQPPQFLEHQHPLTTKPVNSNNGAANYQDYDVHQKYEMTQMQNSPSYSQTSSTNNGYPWSTNLQTSSAISGPYRRASIIAVSPQTKWISVPAKIVDRINFDTPAQGMVEHFEHHDDRDIFHKRFN